MLSAIAVYGVIAFGLRSAPGNWESASPWARSPATCSGSCSVAECAWRHSASAPGSWPHLAIAPRLRSQLYGISMFDPLVFMSVPAVLLGVSFAAGYLPAIRAVRVDPVGALREG